jgi:integral membrane sensor domain MASE1
VLVVSRTQRWPSLLGAVLAAAVAVDLLTGKSVPVSLAFALIHSFEGFVGAWLLVHCCGPRLTLTKVREVLSLTVLAALVGPALAATLATVVVMEVSVTSFWHAWYAWWAADMLGVLLVAPVIVTWSAVRAVSIKAIRGCRIAEAILLSAATTAVVALVFGTESDAASMLMPRAYLTFPLL